MPIRAMLTADKISVPELHGDFIGLCAGEGAVVSFCGLARSTGVDGAALVALHLERHPRLTLLSLERIARDASERFDIENLLIVHRDGKIAPKEVIVFVAAASRHRRTAFLAADYMMDRLKTEAILWKKEEGIDGGRWIEPTEEDRAAVARWT